MARSPDRIGDVIADRYELVDVVGRGGQGLVYKAFDRWVGRSVAIKVLSSKAAREPQMAQRLIREQQALFELKGTAAVELFDVCRGNDGELYLVMELLTGVDLDEHLYTIEERSDRLSLPRIAEIFDPIVETLEVAHAAGILHRDLKPANVFLVDGGGVRLLDFGLARLKSAAPLTAAGTVMGSPSFMAPEAWKGLSDLVDHRADVYSLGVILFRCVCGELPFAGESLHEKFLGSTEAARPSMLALRPDLPRDADEWVAQALAIDREERFGNVRAIWSAFLATFHVQPPRRAKGPSLWDSAKRTMGRLAHVGDKPRAEPIPPATGAPSFGSSPPVPDAATSAHPPAQRKLPSAFPRPRPRAPAPEPTLEIADSEMTEALPPRPAPPPPPRGRVVERTLELSDGDLELQDAIPEGSQPQPATKAPAPGAEQPAAEARASEAERKKERDCQRNRRKKRKKQRKR